MISRDRCKETYQGDRCCKPRGHSETEHESYNAVWDADGVTKLKFPSAAPRRNRTLNRFLREFDPVEVQPQERPSAIRLLSAAITELRGGR